MVKHRRRRVRFGSPVTAHKNAAAWRAQDAFSFFNAASVEAASGNCDEALNALLAAAQMVGAFKTEIGHGFGKEEHPSLRPLLQGFNMAHRDVNASCALTSKKPSYS